MENMSVWGMGNKENERDLRMKTKAGREEKMRKDEEKGKKEKRKQQKEPSTRESSRGGDWLFQPSPGRKLIRRGWTGVSHTHTHRVSERSNLSAAKDVNEGKVRVKRISFLAPR